MDNGFNFGEKGRDMPYILADKAPKKTDRKNLLEILPTLK